MEKLAELLLIDERLGRNAAEQLKISVIGTGGLLLAAKQQKIILSVKPLIEELITTGYRISPELENTILRLAKEL